MPFDQSMEEFSGGRLRDEAKIPYKHSSASTSFEDVVTDSHDIDIEIEEISDADFEQNTDIKVLKPDEYEEPPDVSLQESDLDSRTPTLPDPAAQHDHLIQGLRSLRCDDGDIKERSRSWLWNSKYQWTMETRKRSHSQSASSDTEIKHTEPLGGHGSSDGAGRLRRRVRKRSNQILRVLGRTAAANTIKIEEADDDVEVPPATLHHGERMLETEDVGELGDVMDID